MNSVSIGFEIISYLHLCRNENLIKEVEVDYFKNKYVKRTFKITKDFHKKYGKIPFLLDDPSTEQIEAVIELAPEYCNFDDDLTEDQDKLKQNLLVNVKKIITSNYLKYNQEYIKQSFKAWVTWNKFESSVDEALTFIKTQEVTTENVQEIVNAAMKVFHKGSTSLFEESESHSFWDAETHHQPEPEDVMKTGFYNLDRAMTKHGGITIGEVAIFVGPTNIGKSILLINIALGLAIQGNNVCLASLEMAHYDIAARAGANFFAADINDYDFNNQLDYLQTKLDSARAKSSTPVGELIIKQFHKATPDDLDNWVLKEEKDRDIKVNCLVVDYLGEMGNAHGTGQSTGYEVYMYHKQNTQDLSRNAILNKYAVLTAHQSKEVSKEATDMSLDSLSESKGVTHKPGIVFGILQPPEAKADGKFYLKNLKTRGTKYLNYKIEFDIDYKHMRLTDKVMLEPEETI